MEKFDVNNILKLHAWTPNTRISSTETISYFATLENLSDNTYKDITVKCFVPKNTKAYDVEDAKSDRAVAVAKLSDEEDFCYWKIQTMNPGEIFNFEFVVQADLIEDDQTLVSKYQVETDLTPVSEEVPSVVIPEELNNGKLKIVGQVKLVPAISNDTNVQIQLYNTDTKTLIDSDIVDNIYYFDITKVGNYTVVMKKNDYSKYTVTNIEINTLTKQDKIINLGVFNLYWGDYNSDNKIDYKDIDIFSKYYGYIASDIGYNARYDIDDNGRIDGIDYNFLLRNEGEKSKTKYYSPLGEFVGNSQDIITLYDAPEYVKYRNDMYDYLKSTLSNVITKDDLDIFIRLISYIFGDLYFRASKLPWQIDVDKVDDEHLKDLSSLIGYVWNNALTPNEQREAIKLYCLIRRDRGTSFGLTNLIRVFGQSSDTYYSAADLRGVEIIEYDKSNPMTSEPMMYPGDIKIRVPELSEILRESVMDTKLAGTRLIFVYYIFLGIYNAHTVSDLWRVIKYCQSMYKQGYDPTIESFAPQGLKHQVVALKSYQLSHRITRGKPEVSVSVLIGRKLPYINGFVFNEDGLENYRGYVEANPEVESDEVFYS